MANGISHGQDREAEGKGHAEESNANVRKCRCQYGTSATTKDEPERADKLRCEFVS
jgi:hypothetical protein